MLMISYGDRVAIVLFRSVLDAALHIVCSIPMIEHPVFMVYVQARWHPI